LVNSSDRFGEDPDSDGATTTDCGRCTSDAAAEGLDTATLGLGLVGTLGPSSQALAIAATAHRHPRIMRPAWERISIVTKHTPWAMPM
jgi:hypothetical protein